LQSYDECHIVELMSYDMRHRIPADDGRLLDVATFEPMGSPRAVAVIVGAMATPSAFYDEFARWLADRGVAVVTFEFRGMGSVAEMKAETGDIDRWTADADTVLAFLARRHPGVPVTWIGHSLGGQLVPYVDHAALAAIVTVASGEGYWRLNVPGVRWRALLLWWLIAPVAITLAGYFPGKRLGIVGDLPKGALYQWRRWCLHANYLQVDHPDAAEQYASVKVPLISISFTDDELLSGASIQALNNRYVNAEQVHQRFSPEQLDGRSIGHHGFFRRSNEDLWDELVLPWIPQTAETSSTRGGHNLSE
jgi:predicted alpha/beta hydrolase